MRNIYCAECATKLIKSHPEDVAAGMGRRRVWITLERSGLVCDLCCTALDRPSDHGSFGEFDQTSMNAGLARNSDGGTFMEG
jgi:hypothetical protein